MAETPINTRPDPPDVSARCDGYVAVPTAPGLGVDLDPDVFESLRVVA